MSHTRRTFGVLTLIAAAGLMLAGCGNSTKGSPTSDAQTPATASAAASASAASQWDPCTIPDSAISGLGLDTSTKDDKVAGTTFDGWKVCHWKSADKTFDFGILTSGHSLDDYKQRTDYQDFTPTTAGSHQAVQYRPAGSSHDLGCSIAVQIPGGAAGFDVLNRYGTPSLSDPCAAVRRLTDGLAQYLPNA